VTTLIAFYVFGRKDNPGTPYEEKRFDQDDTVGQAEKKQMEQEINAFANDVQKMRIKSKYAVEKLRFIADDLDDTWKNCKIASALGNGAGIVGALMTIYTAGTALPLAIAGAAFGAAGACTNLGANYVESSTNSSRIQEADRAVEDANCAINDVRERIRLLKDGKSATRLVFLADLAAKMLGHDNLAAALIKNLLRCEMLWKVLPEFAGQHIPQLILKLGEATTSAVGKVSRKVGADKVGSFISGVSVAFIILDTVELGFTIKDIVNNKGSHAARWLRYKADELEEILGA